MSKARKARSPRAAVIERSGAAMNRAAVLCDHRRRESLGPNARRSADPGPGSAGCPVPPDNQLA